MSRLKANVSKLSPFARQALETAVGRCLKQTNFHVTPEHWLLTLYEPGGEVWLCTERLEVSPERVRAALQADLDRLPKGNNRAPSLSPETVGLLEQAWLVASLDLDAGQISPGAVLLALVTSEAMRSHLAESVPELLRLNTDKLAGFLKEMTIRPGAGSATAAKVKGDGQPGAPKVFLSYRRSDSEAFAQMLYYCLTREVDGIQLFRDNDTLQPGMVYSEVIEQNIANCDALVLLIGKKWLKAKDKDGRLRLHDDDDWVRLEIAAALRHDKRIIPCLIDGARMPANEELPQDLQAMTRRHAMELSQKGFERDVRPLVETLQSWGQ